MKIIPALLLASMLLLVPTVASAQAPCLNPRDPLNHTPLEGVWSGADDQWALAILSCGNHSVLFWRDTYGVMHRTDYYAFQALPGGGWMGRTNVGPLVSSGPAMGSVLGYKPAEPGTIQIFFVNDVMGNVDVRHGRRQ